MKIILLDNVKDIGQKGSIVTVADGLAENKLIPSKKAVPATKSNIAKYEAILADKQNKNLHQVKKIEKIKEHLTQASLKLKVQANKSGTLYKTIRVDEVLSELKKILPSELLGAVSKTQIIFDKEIKSIGTYQVNIHGVPLELQVSPA